MTMKLTGPKATTPPVLTFADLRQDEHFTVDRGTNPSVYQKMEPTAACNAVGIVYGHALQFKLGAAVFRVNIEATWDWADAQGETE